MSSTYKTPNMNLSQFTDSDIPSWLTDYNNDMLKIDNESMKKSAYDANGEVETAGGIASYADSLFAKTDSLFAKKVDFSKTTGQLDLYISPTGNDNTGNGSQATPYATFAKAWSDVPLFISHAVTIHVLPGTYTEDEFVINNRFVFGGSLLIVGGDSVAAAANYVVKRIVVAGILGGVCRVTGLTVTYSASDWRGALSVSNGCTTCLFSYMSLVSTTNAGLVVGSNSYANIENSTISNKTRAIYVSNGARARVYACTGSNNNCVYYAQQGGLIAQLDNTIGFTYNLAGQDSGIVLTNGVIS